MNLTSITSQAVATMSSLEISELTGVRHDNTRRAIERCAERGAILFPPAEEIKIQRERRMEKVKAYVFSGEQGRLDSITVIAQLSPKFTSLIVKRWDELEKEAKKSVVQLPDFTNPAVSARAWAEQYEARLLAVAEKDKALEEKAQAASEKEVALEKVDELEGQVWDLEVDLSVAKPKAEFVDKYVEATNSKGVRAVAKLLSIGERAFVDYLLSNKIMYRLHGELTTYQSYLDKGYFEVKTGLSDSGHSYNSSRFTPKGITWITKRISK